MSQKGVPKNKPKISQTHPEFVQWMQNKVDGDKYSHGSDFKINWVYNPNGHSIQDNCKRITLSAGRNPVTNERLHWMFYDDYLMLRGCPV